MILKLNDLNTTDIRDAILLGCHTMCNIFNANDNDIPFFVSVVSPRAILGFPPHHSESHVPGRHLNALLSAENVLGILIDESAIEKHTRAVYFSYSGVLPFPLNRAELGGPLTNFLSHNFREGFHALYALTAFRPAERARAQALAEACIAAIFELWNPETNWDEERLKGEFGLTIIVSPEHFLTGLARAIGPLVKYHLVTQSEPALRLATILKDKVIGEFFPESGILDFDLVQTHTHSINCVLSSLAQLAEANDDTELLVRVKSVYDDGLPQIANSLGWSIENSRTRAGFEDFGEANNTGDIVETALILARNGYPEYYDHVERILRGHLLPSQLRDTSFIEEPDNPEGSDGKRNIAQRHQGAFGFPAPYGHHAIGVIQVPFNMDIVGGVVGSLCEAYREIVHSDGQSHRVNLLFDHETAAIKIESPYTCGSLRITVKQAAPLFVRLPLWVHADELTVSGDESDWKLEDGYIHFDNSPLETITIDFPLPIEEVTLTCQNRSFRARMRGDEVIAMENFGANLTFFEAFES